MQPIFSLIKILADGVRRDMRVRWGVGAGASVLLSAGVLGLGGTIVPGFLHASSTAQSAEAVQEIVPTPPAPVVFPTQGDEGFMVDRSQETVAQVLGSLPKASRFELMLYNSGAGDTLKRRGMYTVFVPSSAKFDYLPKRYLASLSRHDASQLALSHMVSGALPVEESLNGDVATLGGTRVSFEVDAASNTVKVGGANVLAVYKASNGYVYIIDKVLVGGN